MCPGADAVPPAPPSAPPRTLPLSLPLPPVTIDSLVPFVAHLLLPLSLPKPGPEPTLVVEEDGEGDACEWCALLGLLPIFPMLEDVLIINERRVSKGLRI